jgi:hypothetical protein
MIFDEVPVEVVGSSKRLVPWANGLPAAGQKVEEYRPALW